MKKRIKYTDEPMDLRVIPDFLPPPDRLRLKRSRVKVTLEVARESIDFYKAHTARGRDDYRQMMEQLLELYASRHARGNGGA